MESVTGGQAGVSAGTRSGEYGPLHRYAGKVDFLLVTAQALRL